MPGIASAATSVVIAPCRGRHVDDPRRRRRRHAAQPRAAGHRRAVRDAGRAASRPHRPRARPRAGHRHGDGAGAAAQPRGRRRQFPAGRRRAARLFRAAVEKASACAPCPARARTCKVWILGSSTYGAQLAAMLGLPYAFASHFAPADLEHALDIYRSRFQPSEHLDKPYVMLGTQRLRRADRRGGAAAVQLAAAGLRQSAQRTAGQVAAAGRRI